MAKVRLFITPSCPYCITLKEFLKENKIEFEEVDVAENAEIREEVINKSGQVGVPIIEIDGQFIAGFDKAKISKLLNIKD